MLTQGSWESDRPGSRLPSPGEAPHQAINDLQTCATLIWNSHIITELAELVLKNSLGGGIAAEYTPLLERTLTFV